MEKKILTLRANADDLEHLKTIKEYLEEQYLYPGSIVKQITDTDVIKFAIQETAFNLITNLL